MASDKELAGMRIEVPKPTKDQEAYLERILRSTGTYDRTALIGPPRTYHRQRSASERRRSRWTEFDELRACLHGFVPKRNVLFGMLFTAVFCLIIGGMSGYGVGIRHAIETICSTSVETK